MNAFHWSHKTVCFLIHLTYYSCITHLLPFFTPVVFIHPEFFEFLVLLIFYLPKKKKPFWLLYQLSFDNVRWFHFIFSQHIYYIGCQVSKIKFAKTFSVFSNFLVFNIKGKINMLLFFTVLRYAFGHFFLLALIKYFFRYKWRLFY